MDVHSYRCNPFLSEKCISWFHLYLLRRRASLAVPPSRVLSEAVMRKVLIIGEGHVSVLILLEDV